MKYIPILLASLLVISCEAGNSNIAESKREAKYTIWMGNSVIAWGHFTDSYTVKDGMITYTDIKSGKITIVPQSNVQKIEKNTNNAKVFSSPAAK